MTESQTVLNKETLNDSFDNDIKKFVHARLEHTNYRNSSPVYGKVSDDYQELYKKIESMLPQDGRDLLFELDGLVGLMGEITQEVDYRQGFADGVRLLKIGVSL